MPDRNMTIFINGNAQGLTGAVNQAKGQITNLTKHAKSGFNDIERAAVRAFAAFASYKTIQAVAEFDAKIRRTGIDANMSTAEMMAYKQQILDTGIATGVSTDDLTDLGKAALHTSKNVAFVRQEMAFMARVSQASGASGEEVGNMLGNLQRTTGLTGAAFEDLVTGMGAFGKTKISKMTFKDFLPQSEKLTEIAKMIDPTTGARFQKILMEGMMTGHPDVVARAYGRLMDPKQVKNLAALGLKPRDFNDITTFIAKVMGLSGRTRKEKLGAIGAVLGIRSEADLERLITDFKGLDGTLATLDRRGFMAGASQQAESFEASMNRLKTVGLEIAEKALGPSMKKFADYMANLKPEDIEQIANAFSFFGDIAGRVAQNLLNIVTFLDQGIDLLGRWNKIVNENEKRQKDLEDKAKFIREKQSGKMDFEPAPSSTAQNYFNVPASNAPSRALGGFPGTAGSQALAESLFGAVKMDTTLIYNGKDMGKPDSQVTKVGVQRTPQ